jgi:hypothetical protein
MNNPRFEDILKSAEHHHEQYLKNIRLLFETQATNTRITRIGSNDVTASPLLKAVSFGPVPSNGERSRRPTNESPRTQPVSVFDGLVLSGEESGDFLPLTSPSRTASAKAPDSLAASVSKSLPRESFSEQGLVDHIRSVDESTQDTVTALGDVWQKRTELDASNILTTFESGEGSRYESATYEVYEVGRDGTPKPKQIQAEQPHFPGGDGDGDNRDVSVWGVLRESNSDGNAVGRMT